MNILGFRHRHIPNASYPRRLPAKPGFPLLRLLRVPSTFRASGAMLDIWQNPIRHMQGKPYFRVLVFPNSPECKFDGVHDGELHVYINVPRKGGNETLLPFLAETLGINVNYELHIASADRKIRLKRIRIERKDKQPMELDNAAAIFNALNINVELLANEPAHKESPA